MLSAPQGPIQHSSFSSWRDGFQTQSLSDWKWKSFVRRKICSFCWGLLHLSCLPNLMGTTALTTGGPKERANYFWSCPCSFPWCHYWANWSAQPYYQMLKSRVRGGQEVCAYGCKCQRSSWVFKEKLELHLFIYGCMWTARGEQRHRQEMVPENLLNDLPSQLLVNQKLRAQCFKINLFPHRLWALISQWKFSFKIVS